MVRIVPPAIARPRGWPRPSHGYTRCSARTIEGQRLAKGSIYECVARIGTGMSPSEADLARSARVSVAPRASAARAVTS
jgi:hypothetical protein